MALHRKVGRRCAIRYMYLISTIIVSLVIISIYLSLFQTETRLRQHIKGIVPNHKEYKGPIVHVSNSLTDRSPVSVTKLINKEANSTKLKCVTWDECRRNPGTATGNALIDDYGNNNMTLNGENGRGVIFVGEELVKSKEKIAQYQLNVLASDLVPLNRKVPDVRFKGCAETPFPGELPTTSIIVTFHDEWPSVLYRTVYSIVNRTPRRLLQEIILVDDCSNMASLAGELDTYIQREFPTGLIKVIRMPTRSGLIQARLAGWRNSTGEVLVFLDSHMEVNIDWYAMQSTSIY